MEATSFLLPEDWMEGREWKNGQGGELSKRGDELSEE